MQIKNKNQYKIHSGQAGYSLIEVLVAIGLSALAFNIQASLLTQHFSTESPYRAAVNITAIKSQITSVLNSPHALHATLYHVNNAPSFSCLMNPVESCKSQTVRKNFSLYRADQALIYDGIDQKSGFTANGQTCKTYEPIMSTASSSLQTTGGGNSPTNTPDTQGCNFHLDLTWEPVCPNVDCTGISRIKISGEFTSNQSNLTGANLKTHSFSVFLDLHDLMPPLQPWPSLVAGSRHLCFKQDTGRLYCWGKNWYGQVGNGTLIEAPNPVLVLTDVAQVSAGVDVTCAVKNDGSLWCWGYNGWGAVGDGTYTDRPSPKLIMAAEAKQVSVSFEHGCVVKIDGSVWCWGENSEGQYGDNNIYYSLTPIQIIPTGVVRVVTSSLSTCLIGFDSSVRCLSDQGNWDGIVGAGDFNGYPNPTAIFTSGSDIVSMFKSLGQSGGSPSYGCALFKDGSLQCWGSNTYKAVTTNPVAQVPAPLLAPGSFKMMATGRFQRCMADQGGTVTCQGQPSAWDLFAWDLFPVSTPINVVNPLALAVGDMLSCGQISGTDIKCWGYDKNYAGKTFSTPSF